MASPDRSRAHNRYLRSSTSVAKWRTPVDGLADERSRIGVINCITIFFVTGDETSRFESGVDGQDRTVRVLPDQVWAIENNVSSANMNFAEFVDAADKDGVFRGTPSTNANSSQPPVETRRLTLTKEEFVAIAERATLSTTLRLLAHEARTLNFEHVSLLEADYQQLQRIHTQSDYSNAATLIGYDEFPTATAGQGRVLVGHLPLVRGHWQFLLTPDTRELIAAMKYQAAAE